MTDEEGGRSEARRLDQEFRRGYERAIDAVLEQLRVDQYLLADDAGNFGETTRAVVACLTLSILNLHREVQREWEWTDRLDDTLEAAKTAVQAARTPSTPAPSS